MKIRCGIFAAVLTSLLLSCDHGLTPPDEPPVGVIRGMIEYVGTWPPPDSLHDLRFVAMRFIPQDTSDFLQLNRVVFTPRSLRFNVERDTFTISNVAAGTYVYSGVAQQYTSNIFSWRPVGLYQNDDGIFQVRSGDTTDIEISVDFSHPPPFPPQ